MIGHYFYYSICKLFEASRIDKMNSPRLYDKEMLAFIECEIQEGELDVMCLVEAERESHGNDDLMEALYILKRLDVLKSESVVNGDHVLAPKDVNDEVVGKCSTGVLVRYQSSNDVADSGLKREFFKELRRLILGNVVLMLSSISAVIAFMILMGYTVYNFSYMIMFGLVLVLMVLPHLFSNLLVRRSHLAYIHCLSWLCVMMCIVSMGLGVSVMVVNPKNYVEEWVDDGTTEFDKQEEWVNIMAVDDESVVTNRRF